MIVMEGTEPTKPRPTLRTGIPLKLSAETLALPPIRIPVGIGFTYREKSDGSLWTLTGLRSGRTVILDSATTEGEFRDRVSVETLADDFEHVGCDHANNCCTLHGTHVDPHRGCMMR